MGDTIDPEHNTRSGIGLRFTVGSTIILNTVGVPEHVLDTGVTVRRPDIGMLLVFAAVKDRALPEPEPAIPILVFVFVQLKVVFATDEPPKV
jgi:hypothetical protein